MTANHDEENSAFEEIVKDKRDPVAMITYCFYKLDKIKYFKDNPTLDQTQKHATCRALIAPDNLSRIKRDAVEMLRTAVNDAIVDAIKNIKPKSARQNLCENVAYGLLVALIAPFVWLILYYMLKENNLWKPFVEWVNSRR